MTINVQYFFLLAPHRKKKLSENWRELDFLAPTLNLLITRVRNKVGKPLTDLGPFLSSKHFRAKILIKYERSSVGVLGKNVGPANRFRRFRLSSFISGKCAYEKLECCILLRRSAFILLPAPSTYFNLFELEAAVFRRRGWCVCVCVCVLGFLFYILHVVRQKKN